VKKHIKYSVKRQNDGSYVILMKYLPTGKLTIHSSHDTYEDAHDEWVDLHHKPSQAETIAFLNDLTNTIQKHEY
jgi:hypothetical protein